MTIDVDVWTRLAERMRLPRHAAKTLGLRAMYKVAGRDEARDGEILRQLVLAYEDCIHGDRFEDLR